MTTEEFPGEIQAIRARIEPEWPDVIETGPGWFPLLERLDAQLAAIAPEYVVQQIKSKFGSLRFYARPSHDPYDYREDFQLAIREAETQSLETCEECGGPALTLTIRMWVWTLCDEHAREKRDAAEEGIVELS